MTRDTVLQLLQRGAHLVAAIPARLPGRQAWVGIYPIDPNRRGADIVLRGFGVSVADASSPLYRIRAFEVAQALIDADASVGEADLENPQDLLAIGDDDLETKLRALGVELEQLERPFKSDYPI